MGQRRERRDGRGLRNGVAVLAGPASKIGEYTSKKAEVNQHEVQKMAS